MFDRIIKNNLRNTETSFLWGPRQVGKTTVLKSQYPQAVFIDLLESDHFRKYTTRPQILSEELLAIPTDQLVVIDEIQRVPELLNEVHRLMEKTGRNFILSGSSARKLKRGHANLLGGRAIRHEMFGLVSAEVGARFDLMRFLNHGNLPKHYLSTEPKRLQKSYVSDYLKEEVAAEGLTRNLPAFADFLRVAALMDTEIVNFANAASECGVSQPKVKGYFGILEDTLLGRFLPSFSEKVKRRVIAAPRFFFSNVGIVNSLLKRGAIEVKTEAIGSAFESFMCHELFAHRSYGELDHNICYWRTASGIEVDFILGSADIAIELKAKDSIGGRDLSGLKAFAEEFPKCRRILVSLVDRKRITNEGIEIYPVQEFLSELWAGKMV
jgi:uncharacterized protein